MRWGLLGLWAILSINNMFKLNYQAGSDVWGHIDYIDYIATKGTLPLAPEGWQMFQSPAQLSVECAALRRAHQMAGFTSLWSKL